MKPRLFLTGEMGAGKSTAILAAVGKKLPVCGGFLTKRNRDGQGNVLSFSLRSLADGREDVFLEFPDGKPLVNMEVFETLGVSALRGEVLLLDEIGGIELLSDPFREALEDVLRRDVPILGVLKGKNPADALAKRLGLSEAYRLRAEGLWERLSQDERTQIYTCQKYDEKALTLAKQWVSEYLL